MKTLSFKRKNKMINVFLFSVLAVLGIIMIAPFIWMLGLSFEKTANITIPFPPRLIPKEFSIFNYEIVLENGHLIRAYLNSGLISVSAVIIAVVSSLLAGYAFSKGTFKGKRLLFVIILATMMIPLETRLIPMFLMFNKLNLINTYVPLIFPYLLYGFGVLLAKQFFDKLPDSLREASQIDGAGEFRIFFKVFVPLAAPITATTAILSFLDSWNSFLLPLVMINDQALKTIPIFLASFSLENGTRMTGLTMATATMSILPIIVVFLFLQRYIIQSIALSGLKGE